VHRFCDHLSKYFPAWPYNFNLLQIAEKKTEISYTYNILYVFSHKAGS